ncbi:MAG: SCO family protein [Verrucomicrobiota bacterium]
MKSNLQRIQFFVWGFLLLVILFIVGAFIWSRVENGGLAAKPLLIYGDAGDFSLTNQHNQIVSGANLRGKIWVADVIFTRCPLQCVRMTKRMQQLQEAAPKNVPLQFISITADPQFDTPEILQAYAQHYGAKQDRWHFLTGPKSEINRLAVTGLKLVVYEKKPEEREVPADLFLHSTKFVLVDGQGKIRGWFDGEKADTKGEIIRAIKLLLREKKI